MKLSAEIKNDKFIFNYEVGVSKQHGIITLDAEKYLIFCSLLNLCQKAVCSDYRNFKEGITAKAYMERNTKEAVEYLKKLLKQRSRI